MSENLVIEVVSPTKKPEISEEAAVDTVESLIKGLSDQATLLPLNSRTLLTRHHGYTDTIHDHFHGKTLRQIKSSRKVFKKKRK